MAQTELFVDVEEVFEDKLAKRRGRQGWRIISTFYQQSTNSKLDNGYVVYVMGRTQKDKDAVSTAREAKRAAKKKNPKKSNKKTTRKKKG